VALKDVLATFKKEGDLVLPRIDRYLLSLNRTIDNTKSWWREDEYLHPSAIYKCARVVLFEKAGIFLDVIKPRIQRIFDNGTFMHDRWMGYTEKAKIAISVNGKTRDIPFIDDILKIKGKADQVLLLDSVKWVFELKSIKHEEFIKLMDIPEGYKWQLTLYEHELKIPRGIALFEDKNDQSVKEFKLMLDEGLLKTILDKIQMVQYHLQKRLIPNREEYCDCKIGCQKEKWCAFKEVCGSGLSLEEIKKRVGKV